MNYLSENSDVMCCSSQVHPGVKLAKLFLASALVLSSAIISLQAADVPELPVIPKKIDWLAGPGNANLGAVATLRIPDGYQFCEAGDARTFLQTIHAPIPQNMVGILSPRGSGAYYITFEYLENGHLEVPAKLTMDEDLILRALWNQTREGNKERASEGLPPYEHVEWVIKPAYDSHSHLLESAVRTDTRAEGQGTVTYNLQLLGRSGVLKATVSAPRRGFSDLGMIKELVRAASFKPGMRYDDFKKGDRLASVSLPELIVSDPSLKSGPQVANTAGSGWLVVTLVVAGLGLTGLVLLVRKTNKAAVRTTSSSALESTQPQRAEANGGKNLRLHSPLMLGSNGNGNGNGHNNGHKNGVNGKRKRMFNYQKFYTEMMLQGPAPSTSDGYIGYDGYYNGYNAMPAYNGNGNGNGHAAVNGNGNGNGHAPEIDGHKGQNGSSHSARNDGAVLSAHSELIASQKSLIEEQKRLIHEQARLIEEKSKLISEKNQLLDRQSQMIDNNLL
ncbi:MAG TPA: DUF2167 domain-containing protein [Candidatus Dormibacteraeota bacterium]|nr:DUF2167 domain-containing protein [Candidatus Dormibacteraeota bacterium]